MRFMMIMLPGEQAENGTLPDPSLFAAMMKYNEDLMKSGALLAGEGLHPTSKGARIKFEGTKRTVSDGPFAEAKEIIGGYWMIQVKSKEEAVEWAKRCPCANGEVIEIRQVQEMSDFPPEIQAVTAEGEAAIRAHLEQKKQ